MRRGCPKNVFLGLNGAKFRHVVRESCVFNHGKNSHEGVGCVKTSLCSFVRPPGFCCYVVLFLWSVLMSFPDFCWLWLFIFLLHFPWFILYRENVLGGTECACWCVLFRENVLCGTKNSFARKRWGILRLWGHLGHSGALWWFHNPKC